MTYVRARPILLVDVNPSLSILGQPPDAVIGVAYSYTFTFFGGTSPYKCTVVGSVPSGWSFNTSTGELSHSNPTTPGSISLTLKIRDADYRERTQTFTWSVIALPLEIDNNPSNYNAGVAQSFSYSASGGVAPYTWSFFGGTLPPGITLDSDGTFHGTTVNPSGTGSSGTYFYNWFIQVEDSVGSVKFESNAVLVTAVAISITNAAPDGTIGDAYSHTYTSSGGTGAKTWSILSGTVPAGLSLNSAGVLSGTPTTAATSSFTVKVVDAGGTIDTLPESVVVTAPPLTLTGTYPGGTASVAYSQDITISGGVSPYSLTGGTGVISGTLPAGLSLSVVGSALRLSGTPTTEASYSFTAGVTSTDSQTANSSGQTVAITHPGKLPSDVSGNTLWLDFSDPTYTFTNTSCTTHVAADNDFVNGAINKAGVGSNFATGSTATTWKTNQQNGRAVLRCASAATGALNASTLGTYFANDKATLIVVCKTSGITHNGTISYNMYSIASDGGNYFGLHFTTDTSARFNSYNWPAGDTKAQTVAPQDTWYVVLCQHIGGEIKSSVNGGTKTTTTSGNTGSMSSTFRVGNSFSQTGSLDIGEVVGFNSAISDADLADVITWLKWRWGI